MKHTTLAVAMAVAIAVTLSVTTVACSNAAESPARADIAATSQSATPSTAKPKGRLFNAQDLGLLEAADRDQWQKPDLIMDALQIAEGSIVAELGAGSGWFTIRLAQRVQNGTVYAEDIQKIMLVAIDRNVERAGLKNVTTVLGTPSDPKLPLPPRLDAILIVDAFHEMQDPADPTEVVMLLKRATESLKPQGCLGVVDFNPGGGGPGPEERVDPERVVAAANAAGLRLLKREDVPPFQFLLVFGKATAASRCAS